MVENEQISTKQLLEEIIKSRDEIKSYLEASEARQQLQFEELREKIRRLEIENNELKLEVEERKKFESKNNIIIFGLTKRSEITNCDKVCNELNALLNINITEEDINNYYFLGRDANSPLKIEFSRFLVKKQIIEKRKLLKGKTISISDDFTQKQRKQYQLLRKHLILAKKEGKNNCYIKYNKLYIDEESFSYEEILKLEKIEDTTLKYTLPAFPSNGDNITTATHSSLDVLQKNQQPISTKVAFTRSQQKQRHNTTSKK